MESCWSLHSRPLRLRCIEVRRNGRPLIGLRIPLIVLSAEAAAHAEIVTAVMIARGLVQSLDF